MTLALIVATKNSFYTVSDSQTIDNETFSRNTQKVFFSDKHKVALCIAGEANLKFEGIDRLEEVLYVDYVIKQFFDELEAREDFSVDEMSEALATFFETHYPRYKAYFDDGVSYFYGGFGEGNITKIFCHHIRDGEGGAKEIVDDSYTYSDETELRFFANTNAIQIKLDEAMASSGAPAGITVKKYLTENTYAIPLLTITIPDACRAINAEEPCYIGNHLHLTTIKPDSITRRVISYRENPDNPLGFSCAIDPEDTPAYLTYRSFKESNRAFMNGELKKFLIETGERVPHESYAALRIQSIFRGHRARRLLEANEHDHSPSPVTP